MSDRGDHLRMPGPGDDDIASQFSSRDKTPDFSAAILQRVGRETPFASGRVRTVRRWTRVVLSATGVGVAGVAAVAAIWMPELMPWTRETHRPVTRLMADAGQSARESMAAIRAVPRRIEALAERASAEAERPESESVTASILRGTAPVMAAVGGGELPTMKLVSAFNWTTQHTAGADETDDQGEAMAQVTELFRRAERSVGMSVKRVVPASRAGAVERAALLGPIEIRLGVEVRVEGAGLEWGGTVLGQPLAGPQ